MPGVTREDDDEGPTAAGSYTWTGSSMSVLPRGSSKRNHVGWSWSCMEAVCLRCRLRIWRVVREWLYTEAVVAMVGGVWGGGGWS